jgi:predicted CoA-binding protein
MKAKEMLNMKKWAVVGATQNCEAFGYKIFKALQNHGYTVYPVSPKYDEIDGVKAYKSLKDVPEKVDVVDFVVNPKVGMSVLDEIIELGIENIFLQPGTRGPEIIKKAEENKVNVAQSCVLVELDENHTNFCPI